MGALIARIRRTCMIRRISFSVASRIHPRCSLEEVLLETQAAAKVLDIRST